MPGSGLVSGPSLLLWRLRALLSSIRRRAAARSGRTDSQDPSARGCITGRCWQDLTRKITCAPAPVTAATTAWPPKFRSASTTIPGPGTMRSASCRASFCSLTANGPNAAPARPRVPHPVTVTSRTRGNPPPAPRPGCGSPNAAVFSGEHGTSSVVPSIATITSPNAPAPGVPGPASGPASRENSSSNGLTPSRRRALASAEAPGTRQPGPASGPSQPARFRATSR
jgi:hypothetical protein